ncbi:hypothetical protein IMZ11_02395 [Microtetraspora sp. AC03309]|uniref:hypothetical protein n=1 Tax=Microtetraspora sp. AC03309 TaxID=2779376 RepID=UPI001E4CFEB5|nr:hypothetical protein [Microtetraspora sp. AC03309]MCC5574490.1 hypothetical protein [Microtetraspora sp. AC03309]
MPDTIASADITLHSGDELALDRHADGSLTLATERAQVTLQKHEAADLTYYLGQMSAGAFGDGEEAWIKRTETNPDGTPGSFGLAVLLRQDSDNTYSLHLAETSNPTPDDVRATPALRLGRKDVDQIENADADLSAASRVDTGNGDVDVFVNGEGNPAFRHLGDDGKPVEVAFTPKSFEKIVDAVNVVYEGFDELEQFHKGDAADHVTRVDVPTSAGKVRVEAFGEWGDDKTGDRIEITAADDSWGVVIDGSRFDEWSDAMTRVNDAVW